MSRDILSIEFAGLPGAGKSTVARTLAAAVGTWNPDGYQAARQARLLQRVRVAPLLTAASLRSRRHRMWYSQLARQKAAVAADLTPIVFDEGAAHLAWWLAMQGNPVGRIRVVTDVVIFLDVEENVARARLGSRASRVGTFGKQLLADRSGDVWRAGVSEYKPIRRHVGALVIDNNGALETAIEAIIEGLGLSLGSSQHHP